MLKWNKIGISNVAGEVALLSGLVMWATTFTPLRRKIFEIFFYTHHLYIIFVVFFLLHVEFSYSCIMLPGLYLFLIDRYLRFLQSQQRVRFVSARVLPCQVVELNFSKSPGENFHFCSHNWFNLMLSFFLFFFWSSFNLISNKVVGLVSWIGIVMGPKLLIIYRRNIKICNFLARVELYSNKHYVHKCA